jgi:hypothetical protein
MVTSSATTVATHAKLFVAKRRAEILTTRQRMDLARRPENVTVFMLMIIT